MATPLLAPVRSIFHAIARTVVPEAAELDDRGWSALERTVEVALAERDPRVRRQLVTFIRLLELVPMLRYGRPLTRLSASQRGAVLARIERSPLLLVRRGFWGLRTLIFMGYYTQPTVSSAIGYRAHPRGWAARGGTVASVPLTPPLWVEP